MIFKKKILCLSLGLGLLAGCSDDSITQQKTNPWFEQGQAQLKAALKRENNENKAKNVIVFVGDGNGIASVTATRIFKGQIDGGDGEEFQLSYEHFPHMALSKTYNTNAQTPDSAGTATAIMTGIKTKMGLISVNDSIDRGDCQAALKNHAATLMELAELDGRSTGVVTTTRITHATPASTYAHSADRNFEDDSKLSAHDKEAGCKDIAQQLIEFSYGDGIEVAMGGGRRHFLPSNVSGPEGKFGKRRDQRNLIEEWQEKHPDGRYVWNQKGFDKVDPKETDKLFGLFNSSHMEYELDREKDQGGEPSLAEMTDKAIDILSKNDDGFFLLVEGGRIDHAHHAGNAKRALTDGIAMADAVEMAMRKTDKEDTLIIVTADHSHTFVIQGYSYRGNPILGLAQGIDKKGRPANTPNLALDGKPYTTLSYANGPGAHSHGPRPHATEEQAQSHDYKQQALIPLESETHAGEDVAIYARGPWAHLFNGVVEQNYIFHAINHAAELDAER
ncbi:alkaline phosphatase [uncultured Pseudoteredinibacter sp.]|uniref:alkaline phosphatase n=1 Tax=uncultured Pseudoteredinibacter sp. TaxID=1641701 RepID=UPI00260ACB74|nr:alkaline phosphatase [uncultured Pseudoteredinibacter sp.]